MKKSLFILIFISVFQSAISQEFKPFKVGLHLGYIILPENIIGSTFTLEPRYQLDDRWAFGFRAEAGSSIADLERVQLGLKEVERTSFFWGGSFSVNGNYYLSNKDFRPFVGLGVGRYLFGLIEIKGKLYDISGDIDNQEWGFYPRIGFDYKHFNFLIDYNVIQPTERKISDRDIANGIFAPGSTTFKFKNSYVGFKIGWSIGGGRK